MADYAIWTPKFDGDAPLNWRRQMPWDCSPFRADNSLLWTGEPCWFKDRAYRIPVEAMGVNEIYAATPFDYPTWAAQGRANRDKLPSGVAEALGPERDWADKLADAIWPHSAGPRNISVPVIAKIIRKSRCRPIGNDITDEWLDAAVLRVINCLDADERETMRAIIAEAQS